MIAKSVQIFDDPLLFVDKFKAINWMHELLEMYRDIVGATNLQSSFELVAVVSRMYAETLEK